MLSLIAIGAVVAAAGLLAVGRWRRVHGRLALVGRLCAAAAIVVFVVAGLRGDVALLMLAPLATFGLVSLAVVYDRRERKDDDSDDGGGEDGGGGGWPRGPDQPPEGEQPEWWPQFERELAAYAESRMACGDARHS